MENALSVTQLSLTLAEKSIFSHVSFDLPKGSLTLLAGRNGSGKSMLCKCIKGLMSPTEGTIALDGVPLKKKSERLKRVALVFQNADMEIVGQSVEKDIAFGLENLGMKREEITAKVSEMLALFSLEAQRTQHPNTLSGGEKRRLVIADVVAMDPEVILLDEPLANLDYPSTLLVLNTLLALKKQGKSMLIVSHEAEKFLALVDQVLVMDGGQMVFQGTPEESVCEMRKHHIYLPPIPVKEMSWLS